MVDIEEIKLKDLKHISEISSYNNNFYILENKLIHAISDDDDTTELYEVNFNKMQENYIGYCYTSERDIIHFDKEE